MDENTLRLKQIAFLLANQAVKQMEGASQTEKIVFLAKASFSNQEIATIVGTTVEAVAVRKAEGNRAKAKVVKKKK